MRPESTRLPHLANLPGNKPAVVYPWRPAHQQEKSHILWGELLDYLLIKNELTVEEYVEYNNLLWDIGLEDLKKVNIFYSCENCHFKNTKKIVPFPEAVQEIAGEWPIPFSKYSRVFDLMSNGFLSQFLGWKAVI